MPLRADVLVTDHPAPRDALRPGTGPAVQPSGGHRCTGGLVLCGPSVHPSLWGPRSRGVGTCWGGRATGAPFGGAAACRVKPELPSVHLFSAGAGPSESCLGTPPAAGRAWVHRVCRYRTLGRLFFLRRIGRLVNP